MARTVTERPLTRCAICTRQSVARETDLTSCEVQRELCEVFVGSMQYEGWICLTERFDDVGISGGPLDRPALRRLVKVIGAGQVDHVVVHRFDRLTRNLRDWVVRHDLFDNAAGELTAVASGHDGSGSVLTGFIHNVLAAFGEFERDLIGEPLRESRATRLFGTPHGTPTHGRSTSCSTRSAWRTRSTRTRSCSSRCRTRCCASRRGGRARAGTV